MSERKWEFKTKFRARAYGWRLALGHQPPQGSHLRNQKRRQNPTRSRQAAVQYPWVMDKWWPYSLQLEMLWTGATPEPSPMADEAKANPV